jgi:hypothetical protein
MTLPFSTEAFFDVLAAYNTRLWPAAVLLWLVSAWMFVLMLRGRANLWRLVAALLAVHWTWAAVAYHFAFFARINPAAWMFGMLFLFEGAVFTWAAARQSMQFASVHSARGAIAATVVAYALVYPALAATGGHVYPRIPTFGLPCPTTILTIGFLLAVRPSLPRIAAVVPILWAAIGGSAAILFGVWPDLMMPVAASGLLIDVLVVRGRPAGRPHGGVEAGFSRPARG